MQNAYLAEGEETKAFLAPKLRHGIAEMIFILICVLALQEDVLRWLLTENCKEVLLSTKHN